MEIKQLPYEGSKSPVYFINGGGKKEIMQRIINHLNFEQIEQVYNFLKTFDLDKFNNKQIMLQIGNFYFQPLV